MAIEPSAWDWEWSPGVYPRNALTPQGVSIVTINGPLEHHGEFWWSWFDNYESIAKRVEGALSGRDMVNPWTHYDDDEDDASPQTPKAKAPLVPANAVIIRIDSPGGEAAGATALHRKIRSLRADYGTPIYCYCNEMACSAGYEIACACDEVWIPDGGQVGSVGVIATMLDQTAANKKWGYNVQLLTSGKFKADGHADQKISTGAKARLQDRVDEMANIFFRVVAEARDTTPKAIASLEAGVFVGAEAVEVGLADGVDTWDAFLARVTKTVSDTPPAFRSV
jgi:signal peptide peptidase SppA